MFVVKVIFIFKYLSLKESHLFIEEYLTEHVVFHPYLRLEFCCLIYTCSLELKESVTSICIYICFLCFFMRGAFSSVCFIILLCNTYYILYYVLCMLYYIILSKPVYFLIIDRRGLDLV